jgi:N-acetylmuramoyl-L-alanine amidase
MKKIIIVLCMIMLAGCSCPTKPYKNAYRVNSINFDVKPLRRENRAGIYEVIKNPTFADDQEQIRNEIFYGEMELLAQLIHAEAGNQDLIGKILVADVVLNRVDRGFNDCDSIEQVIFYDNAFSSIEDGNFDKAAWNITEEDYKAAEMAMTGQRIDSEIIYFSSEGYSKYGKPAYKYGDHYFSK